MHHEQHPSYILPLELKINPHHQKWDVARSYMAPTSWQVKGIRKTVGHIKVRGVQVRKYPTLLL